jgi:hypothetical protein
VLLRSLPPDSERAAHPPSLHRAAVPPALARAIIEALAEISAQSDELYLSLSRQERLMAFHGDVRIPLASVQRVSLEPDPWGALRGIRAPGTGIPGVVAYGVRRMTGERPDFAAVHGREPAVRVWLDQRSPFAQLLVTVSDAENSVRQIQAAAGV